MPHISCFIHTFRHLSAFISCHIYSKLMISICYNNEIFHRKCSHYEVDVVEPCLDVSYRDSYTVHDADMMAEVMDPFAKEFHDQLSRTVQILNVPKHLLDLTELCVEHKKYGGGEFEKTEYDDDRQSLTVIFVDAKGLINALSFFFCFVFF